MKADGLAPAHRGYQYQDLISAIALVDMLLLRTSETIIDRKLFSGDLFDDLTISSMVGRQRLQLKHSADPDAVLKPTVFNGDARGVRLDLLISAMLEDRAAFPQEAETTRYRLVFADRFPTSGDLADLLHRTTIEGTWSLTGLGTLTWRFEPSELWGLRSQAQARGSLAIAMSNLEKFSEDELRWACARLVVETSAPQFSGDLLTPGPAEEILLARVRDEVGAGSFPNADRAPVDVAARLILAAQSARTGLGDTTVDTLIRRTRLRTDFGAVTAATPVVVEREVSRDVLVADLVTQIETQSEAGGAFIIEGPPGQGKSWVSDQITSRLRAEGWLVAEHYCFLGEADHERDDRVLLDSIFGSLIARLAEADGKLVVNNLPRFTADRSALEQSLRAATQGGERRVALVVDGLDHISRVVRAHRSTNPSLVVCESLALLELPVNVVLVILSQPGDHLAPFAGSNRAELPGMTRDELSELSDRLLGPAAEYVESGPHFLDVLVERSAGNALYATYLCFESARRDLERYATRTEAISALPVYDGTLKSYYEYLYAELDTEGWVVAEELAVANFAMTRDELRQLRSPSRVEVALRVLSPVLRDQVGSGIRFYHESFGRFVRERLAEHPDEIDELLTTLSEWLAERGLFDDQRAFRWLIPTMAEQNRHAELLDLIGDDFVETAIANAFPVRGIVANLARASESAAILADWPGAVRLIQMANAAHTFDFDRFEMLVDFTDVQASFVDPQQIANRLSDGDRLVVSGRQGLLRCAALDAAGAVAPWAECLAAYEREREGDNVHRGAADDQQVGLAVLRGRLRLETTERSARDLKWKNIAKYVDRLAAPVSELVDLVRDVVGLDYVRALAEHSSTGELFLVDLAERDPDYRDMALERIRRSRRGIAGSAHRVLVLGLDAVAVWPTTSKLRKQLLKSTRKVIIGPSSSRPGELQDWLDLCSFAARLDPLGLASAEALVQGEGWYRCWLEFAIELARVESLEKSQHAARALDLLRILEKETNPFLGKPRATDLYSAHDTIAGTIERALQLVSPEQLGEALEILGRVSQATTTIGMGFAGGPLLADVLVSIAERVSPEQARQTLRAHLLSQIADAGADVLYPEVASYHFRLARLDLQDGATETAAEHWRVGVSLLTAYGSHKDATIYELTEPLEQLIDLDLSAVRRALQRLQPITLAVENHTDGRGTNRVHSDWWKEVARADPTWLIDLALPELADHVNSSHWALQRAVEEVWTFHHTRADPRISAAVRVAVEASLTETDPLDLARYMDVGLLDEVGGEALLRAVMSRFDERATSSTYTNAQEILDQTERLVARVNDAVAATVLPRVSQVRPARAVLKRDDRWGVSSRSDRVMIVDWSSGETFAPGLSGVYEAIQVIRRQRGNSEGSGLGPDAYQNAIGYRLVELDEDGRVGDAEQALFALADALPSGERPIILTSLSDGFGRLGRARLAATAGVLAWTRTRQRGGWGSFGAEANLDYLARAFAYDDAVARDVLGREIARAAIAGGSSGPSQALIYAAGVGALPWVGGAADAAMRCWDAACDVVERRTPLFPVSDTSEYPYLPTDVADLPQAEVNRCVAAVALARACAPSREAKRRALVAMRDLLEFRADSIIRDRGVVTKRLSDPVTQHGVLSVALDIPGIADEIQDVLAELARSDLLSIRSVARQHVRELPDLPVCSPPKELLAALRETDWDQLPDPRAEELVEEFLASRIARSAQLMPELESAIIARLSNEEIVSSWGKRVSTQLESLASRARFRWPDAILAHEEEVEREVQILAGAARMARIVVGEPIEKPADWEAAVGARLEPNTRTALDIESIRIPRPDLPAAPHPDDPAWGADIQGRRMTIRSEGDLVDFEIDGWICVGLVERREYDGKRWDAKGSLSMTIGGMYAGEPAPGDIPLGGGTLRWWRESGRNEPLSPQPFPLVAMSQDAARPTGLGAPHFLLTPTPALRGALDLRPADRAFSMADSTGDEVARLVIWRAEYEVSDYELIYPRVQGQAFVIRPNLMAKLARSLPFELRSVMLRTLFEAPPQVDEE